VEWAIHAPIALQHGVAQETIDAIAGWTRPDGLDEKSAAVHDFCVELHRAKQVGEETYKNALRLFGEQGVVDLMGINGYYTFLSMVMNAAQTAAPASSAAPLPD
jgi:4-carboxymuconolactone decarboxylase